PGIVRTAMPFIFDWIVQSLSGTGQFLFTGGIKYWAHYSNSSRLRSRKALANFIESKTGRKLC
ncbi:MAG TPA: hypothetical protein VIK21_04070, partial [Desulfuromonadaceae bacterium]